MIKIEINRDQVDRLLKQYGSKLRNLEKPLAGFGNYFLVETEKQFVTETDPEGNKWADLAPSTLAQKRRLGYPDDILTRTGKMRKSAIAIASAKTLVITMRSEYAIYHQEGTSKMPQRKILGMNDKRREKLARLIRVYLKLIRKD